MVNYQFVATTAATKWEGNTSRRMVRSSSNNNVGLNVYKTLCLCDQSKCCVERKFLEYQANTSAGF